MILLTLLACGIPDHHSELDCPDDCEEQLREHFGVDVENQAAEESFLEALTILATWELSSADWVWDNTPGESYTAQVYNHIALRVDETLWDSTGFLLGVDERTLLVGQAAQTLHPVNLTLNLVAGAAGGDSYAAGQAAEEALVGCEDEETCNVLSAWAWRY